MGKDEQWFILGAGAIGCLWAARLREKNNQCTLIIRPESWDKYSQAQLTLCQGDTRQSFSVQRVPSNAIKTVIKKLVITLKAYDAVNAVNNIKYAIAPDAIVLILLNGMGIQQQIAELLPGRMLWIGCTSDGAWTEKPLAMHHAGKGITWIGPYEQGVHSNIYLPPVNLNINICDNIHTRLWHKLAVNSVINGLTARYRCKNGELLTSPEIFARVKNLAKESEKILKLIDIPLSESVLSTSMNVIKGTAQNKSSTLQDALNKKPTELPWINGFLMSAASRLNLELPEHKRLMRELQQLNIQ